MEKITPNKEQAGLVSIIIPSYNAARYLPKCIESIINQSYKNLEILIIDDGSTDNSYQICNNYADHDNRIRIISSENKGPANARNIGLKNSRGEFISFVDADDFIEENTLSLLIRGYHQSKADLIIGNFRKIKNGVNEERRDIPLLENTLLNKKDLIDYARLYLKRPNKHLLFAFSWGRLFKSDIIKKHDISFNSQLHTFEDVAFNFDYLKHTKNVFFLKEAVYNHTTYDNYSSATTSISDNPERLLGYQKALENISNFLKGHIEDNQIEKEVGHAYTCLSIIQLVRTCGQINQDNHKRIYQFARNLINNPQLRKSLPFYSPSKGDSRIIPSLMNLKLVSPIIQICKYKSHKRYKQSASSK